MRCAAQRLFLFSLFRFSSFFLLCLRALLMALRVLCASRRIVNSAFEVRYHFAGISTSSRIWPAQTADLPTDLAPSLFRSSLVLCLPLSVNVDSLRGVYAICRSSSLSLLLSLFPSLDRCLSLSVSVDSQRDVYVI